MSYSIPSFSATRSALASLVPSYDSVTAFSFSAAVTLSHIASEASQWAYALDEEFVQPAYAAIGSYIRTQALKDVCYAIAAVIVYTGIAKDATNDAIDVVATVVNEATQYEPSTTAITFVSAFAAVQYFPEAVEKTLAPDTATLETTLRGIAKASKIRGWNLMSLETLETRVKAALGSEYSARIQEALQS